MILTVWPETSKNYMCLTISFLIFLDFLDLPHNIYVVGHLFSCPWVCRGWLLESSFSDPPCHQGGVVVVVIIVVVPALTKATWGMHFWKSQNEIYDIGTKIPFLQQNDHSSAPNAPFWDLRPDSESWDRVDSESGIKTRFKAICDIFSKICMRPWIRRLCLCGILPPGGRLWPRSFT